MPCVEKIYKFTNTDAKKKYKVCKNYKNLLMRSGFNDYEWACFASMSSTAHKNNFFTEDIVGPTLLNGFRLYFLYSHRSVFNTYK